MRRFSSPFVQKSAVTATQRAVDPAAAWHDGVFAALAFCCLVLLSACGQNAALSQVGLSDSGTDRSDTDQLYALGSDDTVSVTVYKHEDLSGDFVIGAEGRISLPLIGEVDARGKTTLALAEAIQARFADGYLRDPQVTVQISKYRPFYIFGSVQRPGDYAYQNNMAVLSAIAIAGGYEDDAVEGSDVLIIRSAGRRRTPIVVGLTDRVYPGDIVEMPSSGTVSVIGQ